MNDLRRITRGAWRLVGGGGAHGGPWEYVRAAALLVAVVAVVAAVAVVSGAGSGGSQHRSAAPPPTAGSAASPAAMVPTEPDMAASATPETPGVALVAGFPGAIPVAPATPPAAAFPTPPTLPGMPAAVAPGQQTPPPPGPPPAPPVVPASTVPPPPSLGAGLPTPPPPNPPPSGIPTPPPVIVPPPVVVNSPAVPAAAVPVVQSVVNTPAAADLPPQADAPAAGTMLLSVAVRSADRPDALVSPAVRVFANGAECAEATGTGAIVVQVAVPAACGQPGDLLSFEAGGLDSRAAAPSDPAPACPIELVFDAAGQPVAAYQPVAFAAEPRFVTLDLAALPGCPSPGGDVTPAPGNDTTLTLTVLQGDTPGAPLERPAVTAYVGSTPCARNTVLAGQQLVLTLPAACGQPGTAVTLRAAALDVRYQRGGDAPTCPIEAPPAGVSVPDFQPRPLSILLQPGSAIDAALLLDGCPAGAGSTASASATPLAAPAATARSTAPAVPAPTATPTATANAVTGTARAATATAAPAADPTATPTPAPIATVPTPTSSPAPTATPPPALTVPTGVPGGIIVFVTPGPP